MTCIWGDCLNVSHARGLCQRHHALARRMGKLDTFARLDVEPEPVCTCTIADPAPNGGCRRCSRLVVGTLSEPLLSKALARWPQLAHQARRKAVAA